VAEMLYPVGGRGWWHLLETEGAWSRDGKGHVSSPNCFSIVLNFSNVLTSFRICSIYAKLQIRNWIIVRFLIRHKCPNALLFVWGTCKLIVVRMSGKKGYSRAIGWAWGE
jgi:hypothetical protein